MAAVAVSGLDGSTHVHKSTKYTVFNPIYQIFKAFFWILSKLSHGILKWCGKNKRKHDHHNASLYLLVCGLLLLVPALSTCNTPVTVAVKAQHYVDDIEDPFGILSGKTQLNFLGYGYTVVFARIVKDGRAQIFKPVYKTTIRRISNSWHTRLIAKTLLLLLLLSGDVHLNPGPISQQAGYATLQNITQMQSLSPVTELLQPVITITIPQLTRASVLPGGVCIDGTAADAAHDGRIAGEDYHQQDCLEEAWMGEQTHSTIVTGINAPDCQESTGATELLTQRPTLRPGGSAVNTAPCHPAHIVSSAATEFEQSRDVAFDTGVSPEARDCAY